jgi:hypothetical protein
MTSRTPWLGLLAILLGVVSFVYADKTPFLSGFLLSAFLVGTGYVALGVHRWIARFTGRAGTRRSK